MSYRNKTYVIFDGDNDMWAYRFMRGWNAQEHMEFNFYDAHDIKPLTDRASEDTIRRRLRERLGNTKQAMVLIGKATRSLYRFVRWELKMCLELEVPVIAVNLNGKRSMDPDLCPPALQGQYVVHVSFKMAMIKHALDHCPDEYARRSLNAEGNRQYSASVYQELGL